MYDAILKKGNNLGNNSDEMMFHVEGLMAVSYKKLWKLLVDHEMSKADLRKKADIAPNTMTKLRRNEYVAMPILSRICNALEADYGQIMEYVPDDVDSNGKDI